MSVDVDDDRSGVIEELKSRVEDWKGHRIEVFGRLLLHGNYAILKANRERGHLFKVYLFEAILICCKEIDVNRTSLKYRHPRRILIDDAGRPKFQLKGRIFMQNVTACIPVAEPGSYTCQVFWKGDNAETESFIIYFDAEDTMRKWAQVLDDQRRMWATHVEKYGISTMPPNDSSTSAEITDTRYGPLGNNIAEDDIDDSFSTLVITLHIAN